MPKSGGDKAAKAMCKNAIRGADTTADREEAVKEVFKSWDRDGDGQISQAELKLVFDALEMDGKSAKKLMKDVLKEADADGDDAISYEELVNWMFRAPNLEKYFEKLRALNEKRLQQTQAIHAKKGEKFGASMVNMECKYQEKLDKQLAPLLRKSFKFHDKDNSGVLEVDESIIFFSNYIALLVQSIRESSAQTQAAQMQYIGNIDWTNIMEVFNDENAAVEKIVQVLQRESEALHKSYDENQDERHRAAFKVLDVNGDMCLQEDEVLKAMIPGHSEYQQFMGKLGLVVSREKLLEGVMAS